MDARTYGINTVYSCQEWVDWMLEVTTDAVRVSRGLVLWVCAGVQRKKCYWPGPEGLAWEWWKRGNQLWRPCVWWKVNALDHGTGIPGSGGRQWMRNDWEYILAFKRPGWLPWADNTVMGHTPVCDRIGGKMSNRTTDGQRINKRTYGPEYDPWGKGNRGNNLGGRNRDGTMKKGTRKQNTGHPMPKLANPGNCIIVKARVGGHQMGNPLCHENEAPFPEQLPKFFILSFCPPHGIVLDPFTGSGTTGAVAIRYGRYFLGCDIRQMQVDIACRRLSGEMRDLFETAQ